MRSNGKALGPTSNYLLNNYCTILILILINLFKAHENGIQLAKIKKMRSAWCVRLMANFGSALNYIICQCQCLNYKI